jgi:hypothetical protein
VGRTLWSLFALLVLHTSSLAAPCDVRDALTKGRQEKGPPMVSLRALKGFPAQYAGRTLRTAGCLASVADAQPDGGAMRLTLTDGVVRHDLVIAPRRVAEPFLQAVPGEVLRLTVEAARADAQSKLKVLVAQGRFDGDAATKAIARRKPGAPVTTGCGRRTASQACRDFGDAMGVTGVDPKTAAGDCAVAMGLNQGGPFAQCVLNACDGPTRTRCARLIN